MDEVSKDELLHEQTGYSQEAKDKAAHSSGRLSNTDEHKDEIDALQFFTQCRTRSGFGIEDIKELAEAICRRRVSGRPKSCGAYETLRSPRCGGRCGTVADRCGVIGPIRAAPGRRARAALGPGPRAV